MDCVEAASALPASVDAELPADVEQHLKECLVCQAEAARYKRLSRTMGTLRDQYIAPPEDLLEQVLDSVIEDRHRRIVRRRAVVGIGGLAIAAAGTVAGLVVHSRHKAATTRIIEIASELTGKAS